MLRELKQRKTWGTMPKNFLIQEIWLSGSTIYENGWFYFFKFMIRCSTPTLLWKTQFQKQGETKYWCAYEKKRHWDFPGGSDSKASACNVGDPGFDPWVRKITWRRKWQPTPVLLPGKSHGGKNLVGYSPWGHKELDMTEWLHFHFHPHPKLIKLTAVFQITLPFKNNRINFLEHWVKIIITLDLLTLSRNELFSWCWTHLL